MAAGTLLVLMYHEVADDKETIALQGKIQSSYVVGVDDFRRQMEHLSRTGWLSLSVEEAEKFILDGELSQRSGNRYVVISFDDGFMGNYRHAFPILREYDLVGSYFLATNLVEAPLMLTWAQIREMLDNGMSFGTHGATHRPLGSLGRDELRQELEHSKRQLEDRIASPVVGLSLPHGSIHRDYKSVAREVGYKIGCTSQPGFNMPGCDPFYLGRMSVRRNTPFTSFVALCALEPGIYRRARLKAFLTDGAKRLFGERRYLRAYNRFFGVEERF